MSEFYGLEPGGLLPATALAQLDTARREVVAAGRPDVPATTPYTATQLNAAAVGTEYKSTDGPQGAWRWRKTGATVWTVTDGDTGWRNITPGPEWAGQVMVRRVNELVILHGNSLTGGASGVPNGTPVLSSWPAGFTLPSPAAGVVSATRSGTDGSTSRVIQGGVMYGPPLPAGASLKFRHAFEQDGAWPPTLPGAAA